MLTEICGYLLEADEVMLIGKAGDTEIRLLMRGGISTILHVENPTAFMEQFALLCGRAIKHSPKSVAL